MTLTMLSSGIGNIAVIGCELVDDDDAVGIAGRDVVSLVDLAQADAPGDRRHDVRVLQVHLGRADLGLIRLDRADVLIDERALRVELLAGDGILLDQRFIALQIELCVDQQRLVAAQVSLRLFERRLVGARIDLHDEITRRARSGLP